MKKLVLSLISLLFFISFISAQPCSPFNPGYAGWRFSGILASVIRGGLDGTTCLRTINLSGVSVMSNSFEFNNLGSRFIKPYSAHAGEHSISFDFQLLNDGNTQTVLNIPVTVFLGGAGGKFIYFQTSWTLYETTSWIRVAAPIRNTVSLSALPATAQGKWHAGNCTTIAEFNNVMNYNTSIYFNIDLMTSHSGIILFDNICVINSWNKSNIINPPSARLHN